MNLFQVIRAIEKTAAVQAPVRTIVRNDVFRLNAFPSVNYGAFAWLQNEHRTSGDSDLVQWSFTFFYVDRLTADKGNEVQIQSTGIETLENILRTLYDLGLFAGDYSFRTFNQRFSDECAGVYCSVTLVTEKNGMCATAWEYLEGDGTFDLVRDEAANCWIWETDNRTITII